MFHVAGTNGKGSTVAFLRAALEASGHEVHAFTSPHLVRFNERIRIAGRLIEDETLAALLTEVLDASAGIEPSFFEVATAVALLAFARTPADACILEVGLGGRLDATNIDRPAAGHRHRQPRARSSAIPGQRPDRHRRRRKRASPSAAFRSSRSSIRPPIAQPHRRDRARRRRAIWLPRGGIWDAIVAAAGCAIATSRAMLDLPLPRLPGRHQAMNAALAVAMLRHQEAVARAGVGSERGDGLGRLAGAASAPRARDRSSAAARCGSTAATIRRPPAGRQLRQAPIRRRQAAAHDLRQPRDQGPARDARAVRGHGRDACTPCRSPTTPASRPATRRNRGRARLHRRRRTTASRKRSRADSAGRAAC